MPHDGRQGKYAGVRDNERSPLGNALTQKRVVHPCCDRRARKVCLATDKVLAEALQVVMCDCHMRFQANDFLGLAVVLDRLQSLVPVSLPTYDKQMLRRPQKVGRIGALLLGVAAQDGLPMYWIARTF